MRAAAGSEVSSDRLRFREYVPCSISGHERTQAVPQARVLRLGVNQVSAKFAGPVPCPEYGFRDWGQDAETASLGEYFISVTVRSERECLLVRDKQWPGYNKPLTSQLHPQGGEITLKSIAYFVQDMVKQWFGKIYVSIDVLFNHKRISILTHNLHRNAREFGQTIQSGRSGVSATFQISAALRWRIL